VARGGGGVTLGSGSVSVEKVAGDTVASVSGGRRGGWVKKKKKKKEKKKITKKKKKMKTNRGIKNGNVWEKPTPKGGKMWGGDGGGEGLWGGCVCIKWGRGDCRGGGVPYKKKKKLLLGRASSIIVRVMCPKV